MRNRNELIEKLMRMAHSVDNENEASIAQRKLKEMGIDYQTYKTKDFYEAEARRQQDEFNKKYWEAKKQKEADTTLFERRMKAAFLVRYSKDEDALIIKAIIQGLHLRAFRQKNKKKTDYLKKFYIEFKNDNEKLLFEIYKKFWMNKFLKSTRSIEYFISNNDFSKIPKNQLKLNFK
jgi:hypothetical protein